MNMLSSSVMFGFSLIGAVFASILYFFVLRIFGSETARLKNVVQKFLVVYGLIGILQLTLTSLLPGLSVAGVLSVVAFLLSAVWIKKTLPVSTKKWIAVTVVAVVCSILTSTLLRATTYEIVVMSGDGLGPEVPKGALVIFQKVQVHPAPQDIVLYVEHATEGAPWRVGRVSQLSADGKTVEISNGANGADKKSIAVEDVVGEKLVVVR